jgi:hypothetical protein
MFLKLTIRACILHPISDSSTEMFNFLELNRAKFRFLLSFS